MVGTLAVNIGVTTYERRCAKRLKSEVLAADANHTLSDALVSIGVIVGLAAVALGFPMADPIMALVVTVAILATAYDVFKHALATLSDHARIPDKDVRAVAMGVPGVQDAHHIRTRGTEGEVYADLHVLVAPGMTVGEAHELSERVERAIMQRFPNVIEVLDIACDDCPVSGHVVTEACRGCIAHRCEDACRRGAITFDAHQKAPIDKSRCVECGACARVCPYGAIANQKRPCERACKVRAISRGEDGSARIDNGTCISCGACVYQCPFGAIADKSFLLDVIALLRGSRENAAYKVYAVVAPSISSQFVYARLGQVVEGLRALGFYHVVEAALGADMVAYAEAAELAEKGFLTSSCCPAFVDYIHKQFPTLSEHVSHNLSPAATIARCIKKAEPDARVVFIGPCTAKKMEFQQQAVRPYIDSVITFEELQALFDGAGVDITALGESALDNAFRFVEDAFGNGQEMLLLVTDLSVNRYGMAFINDHGCERYFAHNEDLLFYERGADLADRINRLDLTEEEA